MPVMFHDEEYLNVNEAIQYVAGGSLFVFDKLRANVKMEAHRFLGKGRAKYYKRADLDQLKAMIGPYPVEMEAK